MIHVYFSPAFIMLPLVDRAFLVKLLYLNEITAIVAVQNCTRKKDEKSDEDEK